MRYSVLNTKLKVLIDGEWIEIGRVYDGIAITVAVNLRPTPQPNVVGGSLDGAAIPEGTRDKQTLVWDSSKRRWIG